MKLKTLLISAALVIAGVGSAKAVVTTTLVDGVQTITATDNFNRPTSVYQTATENLTAVGAEYTVVTSGSMLISGSCLGTPNAPATTPFLAYRNDLQTLSTGGNSFTLSSDITVVNGGTRYAGLIWNLNAGATGTELDSYYTLRMATTTDNGGSSHFSILKVSDGVVENTISLDLELGGAILNVARAYTMSVWTVQGASNEFHYSLSGSTGLVSTGVYSDSTYVDGYSGFYVNNTKAGNKFDNYSLSVVTVPEPSTIALAVLGTAGILCLRKRARLRRTA